MSLDNLLLALVIAYFGWRVLSSILVRRRLPGLLKDGAQVVDVRNPVVCCASGTRSAMAAHRLRRLGFARVLNAGSWRTLR
jgi:hypothetical protein